MKNYIGIWFCLFSLTACDSMKQQVDPSLINAESEKLVVACFIAPQDTILTAEVSLSKPVLGENNGYDKRVGNATVTLSDGVRSVILERIDKQQGLYYYGADPKNFPITAGKRYTLTVQIPDGRKVEAFCTVPRPILPRGFTLDSVQTFQNGYSLMEYIFHFNWQDPAGEKNFYRVAALFNYLPRRPDFPTAPEPTWKSYLLTFQRNNNTQDLAEDRQHDGEILSSPRGSLSYISALLPYAQHATCTVNLLHTDENYYRYHDAVQRHSETRDNPFAEPILMPSNIQGGLGCFSAYNRSTLTFTLK